MKKNYNACNSFEAADCVGDGIVGCGLGADSISEAESKNVNKMKHSDGHQCM